MACCTIDSTDYINDDVFMEAELQYSLMASQLMKWLEELDVTSSESPAISIDAQVNCQDFRNSEIKLRVYGRKDELEHREWSEAKIILRQRRKRNQRSERRGKFGSFLVRHEKRGERGLQESSRSVSLQKVFEISKQAPTSTCPMGWSTLPMSRA